MNTFQVGLFKVRAILGLRDDPCGVSDVVAVDGIGGIVYLAIPRQKVFHRLISIDLFYGK
jgi:hypothetical protein